MATSSKKALIQMAEQTEKHAAESLRAWALLGQMEKHEKAMRDVANLRRAAEITSVSDRRAFMRASGFEA